MERLKAVILVGGLGTRLRPLTDTKPKPIMPVVNRPFLEHTIAHLKQSGIKDIILAMSYLPDAIREYFGGGERCGVRLTYCLEKEPLGTAGAVKNAAEYLDGPFLVLNGDDVFLEMDLEDAVLFHREKKAVATIFLTQVENPSAFGVVETDDEGRVRRFIEKPPPGTETTNWINAGGYILEPEVLKHIPEGRHYMFEKGLFPDLLEMGQPVYGYHYKGYWRDMGTPGQYHCVNMDLLNCVTFSPIHKANGNKSVYNKKKVSIHSSAVLKAPVIIGEGCSIGAGVQIKGPAIIGRDCRVNDGAVIENTVLWDGVTIGANSHLTGCIVSSSTVISENQQIENTVVTPSQAAPLTLIPKSK